jgi:hypothetical protein
MARSERITLGDSTPNDLAHNIVRSVEGVGGLALGELNG